MNENLSLLKNNFFKNHRYRKVLNDFVFIFVYSETNIQITNNINNRDERGTSSKWTLEFLLCNMKYRQHRQ